jgi:hypothetical protein
MGSSIKPNDYTIQIRGIKAGLETTRKAIDAVKTDKGTVSMRKLEAKLNSSKNEVAKEMPMFIYRNFKRKVTGYTTNCSGHRERWERYETPKTLKKAQVNQILDLIKEAKKAVPRLDVNTNKRIDDNEAEAAWDLPGLMGKMVSHAVHGARDAYEYSLEKWKDQIWGVVEDVEMRTQIDEELVSMAKHHCRYKLGREAITWAFRELATAGKEYVVEQRMDTILTRAENKNLTPFERMAMGDDVPDGARKKGHLNNTEVKHLLGVDDLEQFIAETKARVEARVGDYETGYLKGEDIPGAADMSDPDFPGQPPWEKPAPTPHRDHC